MWHYCASFRFGLVCRTLNTLVFSPSRATSIHRLPNKSTYFRNMSASAPSSTNHQSILPSAQGVSNAVLRFMSGDERFELQLTLLTGKTLNFNRACHESLQMFRDRMIANLTKKWKHFNGHVSFHLCLNPNKSCEEKPTLSELNYELPTISALSQFIEGNADFVIQIDENLYPVVANPPEVFSLKLISKSIVGLPILPSKLEASRNFAYETSIFTWEHKDPPKEQVSEKKPNKRKISNGDEDWKKIKAEKFFVPDSSLIGKQLRLNCLPSDSKIFGVPFCVEVSDIVQAQPVHQFLFQYRLAQMGPKAKHSSSSNQIRVVSYNILADTLATPEWFVSSPPDCLGTNYRIPLIAKELKSYQGDIVCLQEVDEKLYEGTYKLFFHHELNCAGVYSCKTGNTSEGVATFFNRSKFTVLKSDVVSLREHMESMSLWKEIVANNEALLNRVSDRNTVLQLCIVVPAGDPNMILLVANTHLYFHPDADHIRLLQTLTCVDYISKKQKELSTEFPAKKICLLFCGDFNCTPPFSSYRFLTSGEITANDEDWFCHTSEKLEKGLHVTHDLNLKDSHPLQRFSTITTAFDGCIDYIFYQEKYFKLLDAFSPPSKKELQELMKVDEERKVSLPNFYAPSDHLALISDFIIAE